MAESIDQLQIDIEAQAVKANDAIDKFIGKLDRLSTSIEKIDGSKLIGLSNGVSRLGSAMQNISNVKTSQFTSLTKNISKLGNKSVQSAIANMPRLATSMNQLISIRNG